MKVIMVLNYRVEHGCAIVNASRKDKFQKKRNTYMSRDDFLDFAYIYVSLSLFNHSRIGLYSAHATINKKIRRRYVEILMNFVFRMA